MPATINLLDPSLGIQNVLDMPDIGSNLPKARDLGANALKEPGLEELYAPNNARQQVEDVLCPRVSDGSVLSPESVTSAIDEIIEALHDHPDADVQVMVRDLRQLQNNHQLLQAYLGLMIGG